MGTVLEVFLGVLAVLVAAAFALLFHVKINAFDVHNPWKYESRHTVETVQYVPRTWIPPHSAVRYREMWRARIEGTADFLRVPLDQLDECYQRALAARLSNWNWLKVPSQEWPTAWQKGM